jgi:hypothetical protein
MGRARRPFAQPAFRTQMLKEGMKTCLPLMFPAADRQTAGNGLPAGFMVKIPASPVHRFFQAADDFAFERYFG